MCTLVMVTHMAVEGVTVMLMEEEVVTVTLIMEVMVTHTDLPRRSTLQRRGRSLGRNFTPTGTMISMRKLTKERQKPRFGFTLSGPHSSSAQLPSFFSSCLLTTAKRRSGC